MKPDTLSNHHSRACSSKKPEARLLKNWITSEVLPAVRRNGCYGRSDVTEHAVTELSAQVQALQTTVATLVARELQTAVCALTGRSEVKHVVLSRPRASSRRRGPYAPQQKSRS